MNDNAGPVPVRFDPNHFYRASDPEMRRLAAPSTLAHWRLRGEGPAYTKLAGRVKYAGADLNRYIAEQRVEPRRHPMRARHAPHAAGAAA